MTDAAIPVKLTRPQVTALQVGLEQTDLKSYPSR
jgi:hypothetical protein